MVLLNFQNIVDEIMKRKQRGIPVRESLKDMGISKTTYYRWVDEHGFGKWQSLPYDNRVCAKNFELEKCEDTSK